MAKTKKKVAKVAKPYAQWAVRNHLIEQAQKKGILADHWKVITEGRVEVAKVRKLDDKCETCKHFKFDFYTKQAPSNPSVKDAKIIGCANCEVFITVYLNERTHGNTTVHAYQVAQGVTEYLGVACKSCGYRPLIKAGQTQEQVNEEAKHDCHQWRQNRRKF
jgi:DNA-directed RNA polymerase subunit RPC12/RpoP